MGYTSHGAARLNLTQKDIRKIHVDEPGAVITFGIDSMWVSLKNKLPAYYRYCCNDRVAIHISWYNDGYQYPVFYNKNHRWQDVLGWCSEYAPGRHVSHPQHVIMFMDQTVAMQFALLWS